MPSFFLSFVNLGLSSVGGVPEQDVLGISLVPQDHREVNLDWMCLWQDSWDLLVYGGRYWWAMR